MKIGILAIQGDFQAHAEMFHKLGVDTLEVRTVSDLKVVTVSSCLAEKAPHNSNSSRKRVFTTPFGNSPAKAELYLAPALERFFWPHM